MNSELEALLPKHKCGLFITHNEHRNYYQSIREYLAELEARESPPEFASEDAKRRAIATDELWEIHWYPDTPIGFYCILAPTLSELLQEANKV